MSAHTAPEHLRAWWSARQGLDGSLAGAGSADVLAKTGWSRSVGGAGPYLTIFARAGRKREEMDADVAALKMHELPSARGCTYVVPAADFALALQAGGAGEDPEVTSAKKHLGVTDKELDKLCAAVVAALGKKPLDPRELKDALGGAVRNLGDAGKKRGVTTTLPLALGMLQSGGRIRRVPVNGRLDQQRYAYTAWKPAPKLGLSAEEVVLELARRYFRWAGPATLKNFAWWTAKPAKALKPTIEELGLVPLAAGDERLLMPEDLDALRAFKPPKEPQPVLTGGLDNITHLRREVASLLAAEDAGRPVLQDKTMAATSSLSDLPHHAILDRGRLIGFWAYDVPKGAIVWQAFGKVTPALRAAVSKMESFVRDQLGDARSFSLDSPESRGEQLASLRG